MLGGLALGFELANGAETELDLVVDVVGHQRHLLDHLLLVIELDERALEFLVELLEILEGLLPFGLVGGALPRGVTIVHLLVENANLLDQFAQGAEVVVAAFDLLVEDDTVETLLGRLRNQLLGQSNVFLAGKTEAVNDPFNLVLRIFNALGDLDFLLARQQRDLPHLLEIHPDRVIEDVEPALVLLLLGLGLPDAIDFGLINDLDFETAEFAVDFVEFVGGNERVGQGIVDVGVGQIALFLGQPHEFLDLFGDIDARLALDGSKVGGGEHLLPGLALTRSWSCGGVLPRLGSHRGRPVMNPVKCSTSRCFTTRICRLKAGSGQPSDGLTPPHLRHRNDRLADFVSLGRLASGFRGDLS